MKVLYIPTLNWAVTQWRIEYPAREMYKQLNQQDKGAVYVDYLFDPRDNKAWDKLCMGYGEMSDSIQGRLHSACKFFDIIIIQKIQNKEGLAVLMGLKEIYPEKLFVAEIDDSVGDITPSNFQINELKDHHACAAYHLQNSDAVICSTDYLAKSIHKFNVNTHVYPNCINYDIWKAKKKVNRSNKIRIGYVAGGAHDEDLMIAYRAMIPILNERKDVTFVIRYGGYRPDWLIHPQIDFRIVNWPIDLYPNNLADLRLDIALAPLRDTEFNRCKSNLKWIESSALGIPLVASEVEPFTKTNGEIWLTNNNVNDFTSKIKEVISLVSDKDMAKDISRVLKEENENKYNIRDKIDDLLQFLKYKYDEKLTSSNKNSMV